MQTRLRRKTLVYAVLFCVAAMAGMLYFASHKAIAIANVTQDDMAAGEAAASAGNASLHKDDNLLRFRQESEDADYFCIPIETGVKAEDVTIENRYMERQIWIYIKGTLCDYYKTEAIYGNIRGIEAGSYECADDTVVLKFTLSEVFECISLFEEGRLCIELTKPKAVYDKIVVMDAAGGGGDAGLSAEGISEKEAALDIVKRVKALLEASDIKVYYTRMEDRAVEAESRIGLANAVEADMFISIGLNESGDASVYGTEVQYNAAYFIPEFGNIELADTVLRNVVTAISGRGNGVAAAEASDVLLAAAEVPAVRLKAGYITNEKEAALLQEEAYRNKIAEGIYEAVLAAYEKMNQP